MNKKERAKFEVLHKELTKVLPSPKIKDVEDSNDYGEVEDNHGLRKYDIGSDNKFSSIRRDDYGYIRVYKRAYQEGLYSNDFDIAVQIALSASEIPNSHVTRRVNLYSIYNELNFSIEDRANKRRKMHKIRSSILNMVSNNVLRIIEVETDDFSKISLTEFFRVEFILYNEDDYYVKTSVETGEVVAEIAKTNSFVMIPWSQFIKITELDKGISERISLLAIYFAFLTYMYEYVPYKYEGIPNFELEDMREMESYGAVVAYPKLETIARAIKFKSIHTVSNKLQALIEMNVLTAVKVKFDDDAINYKYLVAKYESTDIFYNYLYTKIKLGNVQSNHIIDTIVPYTHKQSEARKESFSDYAKMADFKYGSDDDGKDKGKSKGKDKVKGKSKDKDSDTIPNEMLDLFVMDTDEW